MMMVGDADAETERSGKKGYNISRLVYFQEVIIFREDEKREEVVITR